MPELPEVELARRNLSNWTHGFKVLRCEVGPKARINGALENLKGATFTEWSRHGKFLTAGFTDQRRMVSHLGMTGKWICDPTEERKHVHIRFELQSPNTKRTIEFIDPRRFGWNRLRNTPDEATQELAHLGPDALTDIKNGADLQQCLGGSRSAIWRRMLDQRRLAGIGTILASEICHRAGIHPLRPSHGLKNKEWASLLHGLRDHIDLVLQENVGPEIDYLRPGMQTFFLCYGKKDSPCTQCETAIVKDTVGGRPVYWCPRCQRL
jgi:formamidopyrimidine-DNA glycosylase